MPRLTLSHDVLIRIAYALLSDTDRRVASEFVDQYADIIQMNADIISAINRARAKDGLLPLPSKVR
jgi:hypothetical protein